MANLGMSEFWQGRRVLVTGHTGFKGSWLTLWLSLLGARVSGLSLPPEGPDNLFEAAGLDARCDHAMLDIRDAGAVADRVSRTDPEIVFHLAAQSLVLRSYGDPLGTWSTNVMGSAHLMEAVRTLPGPRALVMVTTDKVYENLEIEQPYVETDRLGGHDPYSASKAAMEIAVASWRRAFLSATDIRMATARAGNVIGGGDRAENRLLPDIARALAARRPIAVRNPTSVRPWQHVLEPLHGYMRLAERLLTQPEGVMGAFNFGPGPDGFRTVGDVVDCALRAWPGTTLDAADPAAPHEAGLLALDTEKAERVLGVTPRWGFEKAVIRTVEWYRAVHEGAAPRALMEAQIADYEGRA